MEACLPQIRNQHILEVPNNSSRPNRKKKSSIQKCKELLKHISLLYPKRIAERY